MTKTDVAKKDVATADKAGAKGGAADIAVGDEAVQAVSKQDLEAAARVLKSKNSKKRDRRKAAGVLSVVGASKGGTNRARNLSDAQRSEIARLGGLARQAQARERKADGMQTKPERLGRPLNSDA